MIKYEQKHGIKTKHKSRIKRLMAYSEYKLYLPLLGWSPSYLE